MSHMHLMVHMPHNVESLFIWYIEDVEEKKGKISTISVWCKKLKTHTTQLIFDILIDKHRQKNAQGIMPEFDKNNLFHDIILQRHHTFEISLLYDIMCCIVKTKLVTYPVLIFIIKGTHLPITIGVNYFTVMDFQNIVDNFVSFFNEGHLFIY